MNQTMNEMFKKDLPNLHEWCEEYASRTGVKIYAGNPPTVQIVESLMGMVKSLEATVATLAARIATTEEPKKEKKSK